jgi:hypothetical protein
VLFLMAEVDKMKLSKEQQDNFDNAVRAADLYGAQRILDEVLGAGIGREIAATPHPEAEALELPSDEIARLCRVADGVINDWKRDPKSALGYEAPVKVHLAHGYKRLAALRSGGDARDAERIVESQGGQFVQVAWGDINWIANGPAAPGLRGFSPMAVGRTKAHRDPIYVYKSISYAMGDAARKQGAER